MADRAYQSELHSVLTSIERSAIVLFDGPGSANEANAINDHPAKLLDLIEILTPHTASHTSYPRGVAWSSAWDSPDKWELGDQLP